MFNYSVAEVFTWQSPAYFGARACYIDLMAKLVVTDLNSKKRKDRVHRTKVPSRRVKDDAGRVRTVYVLEAKAPNFGDQFEKLFQMNVTRARRNRPKQGVVAAE